MMFIIGAATDSVKKNLPLASIPSADARFADIRPGIAAQSARP